MFIAEQVYSADSQSQAQICTLLLESILKVAARHVFTASSPAPPQNYTGWFHLHLKGSGELIAPSSQNSCLSSYPVMMGSHCVIGSATVICLGMKGSGATPASLKMDLCLISSCMEGRVAGDGGGGAAEGSRVRKVLARRQINVGLVSAN